jgi:hypothetical protein
VGPMGIVSAQAPLVLKDQRLSIDLKKLGKVIGSGSGSGKPVLYDGGGGLDTAFKTITVSGQSDLNAVQYDKETLTVQAGYNVFLSTDPITNTLRFDSTDFHYSESPPTTGLTSGHRWMDANTGIEYVYAPVGVGGSNIWIQPTVPDRTVSILATTSVTGATYSALHTDYYIGVNRNGVVTVTLPQDPQVGREIVVKDESGHAGDGIHRAITIVGYGSDSIDNRTSAILNISNGALKFIFREGWRII